MASPVSTRRFHLLLFLVAALLVWLGRPASTQGPSARARIVRYGGHQVAQGEVIVKYRDPRMATMMAREADVAGERLDLLNARGVGRVRSETLTTEQLIHRLKADPLVEYAEPNYILYALAPPNDPSFASLWGLFNTGINPIGGGGIAGADIDVTTAWTTTTGSRANVVGIIDTGIDYRHPDLSANVWSAPSPFQVTVGGQTITCAAGTHGFNAIAKTCDPMDDNNHGTHVAGTIGAVGNNSVGVTGVNWVASMMGLKFLSASGSGSTSDAILAIEFAIQAKAAFATTGGANVRILSNSWGGGGFSQSLLDAISRANTNEMLFVAAAGNSHTNNDTVPHYPSSYIAPNVVSVASSDSADRLSSFSCYGATSVHLAAPGTSILSTTRNNTYSSFSGTSMATPHVSGVAALVLSACAATTAQLKSNLLSNVDAVSAMAGNTTTGGRLNAGRSVQMCDYPRIVTLTLTPSMSSPQSPGTTVTWTAAATAGAAPYEYQWVVYNGTTWGTPTAWSTDNTFAWTPSVANRAYQVQVRARSAWNSGAAEKTATQAYVVMPVVSGLTLTPSLASPRAAGTPITWTAAAAGGQAPYQFQFLVSNGTTWTALTGWTTAATYTWTPTLANSSYVFAVQARSAWNTTMRERVVNVPFAIKAKVTAVSVASSVAAPQPPNTAVTFTASATGGVAPLQYMWMVYNGTTWTTMTAWTTSTTFAWQPSTSNALYQVQVRVRSAWNVGAAEASGVMAYAIRPTITALTIAPDRAAPQAAGNTITWTATASGGQGPYQYQWMVNSGTTWTTLTGWVTSNRLSWAPTVAGLPYTVAVQARSAWNAGARERYVTQRYTIIPRITSVALTSNVVSPQASGTAVTFTAQATGGVGPYLYKWTVYDGLTWSTPTAWSSSNQLAVTLSRAATNYQIVVYAMSATTGMSATDAMATRESARAVTFLTR